MTAHTPHPTLPPEEFDRFCDFHADQARDFLSKIPMETWAPMVVVLAVKDGEQKHGVFVIPEFAKDPKLKRPLMHGIGEKMAEMHEERGDIVAMILIAESWMRKAPATENIRELRQSVSEHPDRISAFTFMGLTFDGLHSLRAIECTTEDMGDMKRLVLGKDIEHVKANEADRITQAQENVLEYAFESYRKARGVVFDPKFASGVN